MKSIRTITERIFEVEGFTVRFVPLDADPDVARRRVPDYPFAKAANKAWTVAKWRSARFEPTYPEFTVEVLDGSGNTVHGKTLLTTIRASYSQDVPTEEPSPLQLDALVAAADGGDEKASQSLYEASDRAGADADTYETWEEVAQAIRKTERSPAGRNSSQATAGPQKQAGRARTTKTTDGRRSGQEPLGFEPKLWAAADKLRGNLDSSEYKHVVLGLIFLKYVSDSFEAHRQWLESEVTNPDSDYYMPSPAAREAVLDSRDEYLGHNVFWVPEEARWSFIQDRAKQSDIGKVVDAAMDATEVENPSLRGVLPRDYSRPALDTRRLGELIDLIGSIAFGESFDREKDILGRVYEYFLGQFASAEGRKGGEFYTPRHVVRLLVEMLEPFEGRVYDPCFGSGGMFVQSVRFVEAHGGRRDKLSVYGQELNTTTWRLCKMNLALRGIESNLGDEPADSFHKDKHPDLRADFILANPPFNVSDWGGELLRDNVRWKYGAPPSGNANFAWVQHMVHHLAPGGSAGIVLANGSMSSQQSGEGEIRRKLVEADLVDCMVALPGQLFFTTQIPVCLWFLRRDRKNGKFADRRGQVLFIDARAMGTMVDRTHRVLTDDDIARTARTYHAWRGEKAAGGYANVPGFCYGASLDEVRKHNYILTPGRYVGAQVQVDESEPFEEKMQRLTARLREQQAEAKKLDATIAANLRELGFAR